MIFWKNKRYPYNYSINTRYSHKKKSRPVYDGLVSRLAPHWLFIVFFFIGLALRIVSYIAYHPALLYFGDSRYYLQNAQNLRPDSAHPLGYAWFLHAVSWLGSLNTVTVVQHILGLASGVIAYLLLVKLRLKPWVAAVGALPILLDSYLINSENMVLAETLTGFLILSACALLVWSEHKKIWQMVLVGVFFAYAAITRDVMEIMILPAILYIFFDDGFKRTGEIRHKLVLLVALVLSFAVPLIAYSYYHQSATGQFTLDGKTNFFLYGRLAPMANCGLLTPKERILCDDRPVSQRPDVSWYLFNARSPLRKNFTTYIYNVPEKQLGQFDKTVLENQLSAYLGTVLTETIQYFKFPHSTSGHLSDPIKPTQFPTQAQSSTTNVHLAADSFTEGWQKNLLPANLPSIHAASFMANYQKYVFCRELCFALVD